MNDEALFAQQRRVRVRNRNVQRSKWLVIVASAGFAMWVLYESFFWTPVSLWRLRGESRERVHATFGPPDESWRQDNFACLRKWPCSTAKARGNVEFRWRRAAGFYVYFDAEDRLVDYELKY